MTETERHSYDVVVIGAGGAGLRAAIEAREQGKRTAIICKSLFGKAHTVMAEGGIAASMGNVNSNDNWQVHFRDTMRGGKFLNHWRMAELHAKEAPDRVWELETWGALFDRTQDGRISQRNFGGHEYPRLAHVGDRTGLELIRTLQQKIVSLQQEDERETRRPRGAGSRSSPSARSPGCSRTTAAIAGAFGYWRETGRFVVFDAPAVMLATGGIGKSFKVTSNSWEYTGDGHALALRAGATLVNMEFVQFHPTGMVWPPSVKGILVTESVRGDGGVLRNSEGKRFMFDYVPGRVPDQVRRDRGGGRPLVRRPGRTTGAHPSCCPATRWPGRSTPRSRPAAAPRTAGSSSTSSTRLPAEVIRARAAVDAPPVQGAGRRRHHRGGDGGRPDLPLRDGRGRGRPGHRPRRSCRGCSRPARWPAACTARTGSAATRCPTCWSSAAAPGLGAAAYVDGLGADARPAARCATAMSTAAAASALAPFEGSVDRTADGHENPYTLHQELQQTMNDLVGIIRREDGDARGARAASRQLKERAPARRRRGAPAVQPRLAPGPGPAEHAAGLRVRGAAPRWSGRRAAAATPATTTRR